MKYFLSVLIVVSSLSTAIAQTTIVNESTDGSYTGVFFAPDGKAWPIGKLIIVRPTPVTPVNVTGLYALAVRDPLSALDPQQNDVMTADALIQWVNNNCAKDIAGTVAVRCINSTTDLSKEVDPVWKLLQAEAAKLPMPCVVIASPKAYAAEAMAKDPTSAIARLQAIKGGTQNIPQGPPQIKSKRDNKTYFINDSNWKHVVGDGEVVDFAGHKRFLNAKIKRPFQSVSKLTLPQAGLKVFTEEEIKARIKIKDANRSWLGGPRSWSYQGFTRLDQNGYGQCWSFGPCVAFRLVTLKQGGILRAVSPNALARDSGYSNWGSGGGDPSDSVGTICSKGAVRTDIWPWDSTGHSTKWDTTAAKADYANNRVTTCVEIKSGSSGFLEFCSALVQDCPIVATWCWWNHVTCASYLELSSSGEILVGIENSWGSDYGDNGFGTLGGSKKYSCGSWVFVEVVQSTQVPAKAEPLEDSDKPEEAESTSRARVTPASVANKNWNSDWRTGTTVRQKTNGPTW